MKEKMMKEFLQRIYEHFDMKEIELIRSALLIAMENYELTAATQALNRGMPIEQVQQMLGHENIETTLIYAQSAQENVKASHKKYVT